MFQVKFMYEYNQVKYCRSERFWDSGKISVNKVLPNLPRSPFEKQEGEENLKMILRGAKRQSNLRIYCLTFLASHIVYSEIASPEEHRLAKTCVI